jgi:hypothetical protein
MGGKNEVSNGYFKEAMIGVDNDDIYVWLTDVPHEIVANAISISFDTMLFYSGSDRMIMASGGCIDRCISRLKTIFPEMNKIIKSTYPFEEVYRYAVLESR